MSFEFLNNRTNYVSQAAPKRQDTVFDVVPAAVSKVAPSSLPLPTTEQDSGGDSQRPNTPAYNPGITSFGSFEKAQSVAETVGLVSLGIPGLVGAIGGVAASLAKTANVNALRGYYNQDPAQNIGFFEGFGLSISNIFGGTSAFNKGIGSLDISRVDPSKKASARGAKLIARGIFNRDGSKGRNYNDASIASGAGTFSPESRSAAQGRIDAAAAEAAASKERAQRVTASQLRESGGSDRGSRFGGARGSFGSADPGSSRSVNV